MRGVVRARQMYSNSSWLRLPDVEHAWTPPLCQAFICDGSKDGIAAMHPDFKRVLSQLKAVNNVLDPRVAE